jgi:rubrerythrin
LIKKHENERRRNAKLSVLIARKPCCVCQSKPRRNAGDHPKIHQVEKAHAERYKTLYTNLENGKVFEKDGKVIWKCRNCGYLHEGTKAPLNCPACLHPQAYFELQESNF